MTRTKGVGDAQAGLITKASFIAAKKMVGKVPEPLRIWAHSAWSMRASGAFEMAMRRAKSVDERLKTLASLKTSSLVGCVF